MPPSLSANQLGILTSRFDQYSNGRTIINAAAVHKILDEINLSVTPSRLRKIANTLQLDLNKLNKTQLLCIIDEIQSPQQPTTIRKSVQDLSKRVSGWFQEDKSPFRPTSFFQQRASQDDTSLEQLDDGDGDDIKASENSDSDYDYYTSSGTSSDDDDYLRMSRKHGEERYSDKAELIKKTTDVANAGAKTRYQEKQRKRVASHQDYDKEDERRNASRLKTKSSRKNQVRALLLDPAVRVQLEQVKPYFLWIVTAVQIIILIVEIGLNNGFEDMSKNPFGGPSYTILVRLGAKYSPCMRENKEMINILDECVPDYPLDNSEEWPRQNGKCFYQDNIRFFCGMGGFSDRNKPDQTWRFFTPIFLHVGVFHLILNLLVQIRTGIPMEKSMGSIRMMLIYCISGIFGNVFAANLAPNQVSVGASSSLYGLFALLLIDLWHNWPLLVQPWRELTRIMLNVAVSLGIGLLPYVDNFAHIGGFIGGILSGFLFMPSITFGKWDKRRKLFLMLISFPILCGAFGGLLYAFNENVDVMKNCSWCVWLDCIPPDSNWCKTGS